MVDQKDLLQIKIEEAKGKLSADTKSAIDAVNWQDVILKMRETRGYTFEQLGDLEIETELLLCGLLSSDDYPRKLGEVMHIPKTQVDTLVDEMNTLVFSKIKEEFIKITEKKKQKNETILTPPKTPEINSLQEINILNQAGIEIIDPNPSYNNTKGKKIEINAMELKEGNKKIDQRIKPISPQKNSGAGSSILEQKLGGSVKSSTVQTEHSLNNLSKNSDNSNKIDTEKETKNAYPPKADPYREIPE